MAKIKLHRKFKITYKLNYCSDQIKEMELYGTCKMREDNEALI